MQSLDEQLFKAVKHGDLNQVKQLLDVGADIYAIDNAQNSLLHIAAELRNLEIFQAIINQHNQFLKKDGVKQEKCSLINRKNREGKTPLHEVAKLSDFEMVKLLIENGAEINEKDRGNRTPLHYAANFFHVAVIEFLLEKGAKADIPFLASIISKGRIEIIAKCLIYVCENKEVEAINIINFYVKNKYRVNEQELLKELLKQKGLNVNSPRSLQEILSIKISNELKSNISEKSLLGKVAELPLPIELKKYLLQANNFAVFYQFLELVKDHPDKYKGVNPLITAVKYEHWEIVKFLVENGVDLNVKVKISYDDLHGRITFYQTLLYFAVRNQNEEMVSFLLEKGAKVNSSVNKDILHVALQMGNKNIIKILIDHGADVNERYGQKVHCLTSCCALFILNFSFIFLPMLILETDIFKSFNLASVFSLTSLILPLICVMISAVGTKIEFASVKRLVCDLKQEAA
ncbi:MAG: ankyrin repeat domain-containing protein [Rickettsiaceae bacterium H1]|nr:ankyrin repeat domain-containing protein [Rickettsiaceae bacterium H1]